MKRKIFVVAAVIIGSTLHAQEDSTGRLLDEVIMTSNKYPKKQMETGKVVTVIGREQLERSSGRTLNEVLNTVVGTVIGGANNNFGTNVTASIRGGSSGNLLFLVDGIPVNDPSVNTNYFDLNLFAIDQIERIEILKGGQSTLYGSDAVTGVINIITKKAQLGKLNVTGGLMGGSYNTFKQNVGLNGRTQKMNYLIGYTHMSSKGFSSAYDSTGNADFDLDGSQQHVVNTRIGFNHSSRLQSHLFGTYSYYRADLDAAAFTDERDHTVRNRNVQAGTGLTYNHKLGAARFNYTFNFIERLYLDDSLFKSSPFVDWSRTHFTGRTHYVELYNTWNKNDWELLAGADYRLNNMGQSYESGGPFGPYVPPTIAATMHQVSPYASFVYKGVPGLTAEVGARMNFHSEYGSNLSFTLNPSYLIDNKLKLFANLYSAFKTPTLYQLFDWDAGNLELDPERGVIGEVGVEMRPMRESMFRLVGFYRNTNDIILYTYDPVTFSGLYINASNQKNYGVEVEGELKLDAWTFNGNYTYTDGKTKTAYDGTGVALGKDTTYYNLYRIPKHAFNLSVGYQAMKNLFIGTQLRVVGDRQEFIFGAPSQTLDAYAVIDLYGEYNLSKGVKVFVDWKNLTNKRYFDYLGYNSRRMNFNLGANLIIR